MAVDISLPVLRCRACDHVWIPRIARPVRCPRCKIERWSKGAEGRSRRIVDGKPLIPAPN